MKNKFVKILSIMFTIITAAVILLVIIFSDKKSNKEYEVFVSEMNYFNSKDGSIAYRDKGQGEEVFVLIHGVPTSSWMYRDLSANLVDSGSRVISFDLLGFGASEKPHDYDLYDFDRHAQRSLNLLESLNVDSYNLVVHDMGGVVAWEILENNSSNIKKLYILNTLVYAEDFHPPADFSINNPLHKFFLHLHSHKIFGKMIVKSMFSEGMYGAMTDNERARGYWIPLRSGSHALVNFFTQTKWLKENLGLYRENLLNFEGEIFVIWGKHDPFLSVEQVDKLQGDLSIDPANVLVIENSSHLLVEESADQISEFIIKEM